MSRFQEWPTAEAAKAALSRDLPEGTPMDAVESHLRQAGAECVREWGGLNCFYREQVDPIAQILWQLSFAFNDHGGLAHFVVQRTPVTP